MKKSLMMFISALMASVASAYDAKIDGICYNLVPKANMAEVVAGDDKYSGQVVIPSTVEYEGTTYNVTSIAERAFGSCSELTSVLLPKGIKEIKPETFSDCTEIEGVVFQLQPRLCHILQCVLQLGRVTTCLFRVT